MGYTISNSRSPASKLKDVESLSLLLDIAGRTRVNPNYPIPNGFPTKVLRALQESIEFCSRNSGNGSEDSPVAPEGRWNQGRALLITAQKFVGKESGQSEGNFQLLDNQEASTEIRNNFSIPISRPKKKVGRPRKESISSSSTFRQNTSTESFNPKSEIGRSLGWRKNTPSSFSSSVSASSTSRLVSIRPLSTRTLSITKRNATQVHKRLDSLRSTFDSLPSDLEYSVEKKQQILHHARELERLVNST